MLVTVVAVGWLGWGGVVAVVVSGGDGGGLARLPALLNVIEHKYCCIYCADSI